MHIKQIELFGFKSFMDKASIAFSTGICSVVGPNGCGKSNIVDAIRWVLGEQSAKQLRGKLMEEVIFSGANGKASLNFAEVSLVLSNEDGKAPVPYQDYSEIMVTRRLFRSGDSEYLINNIPCRRMDISRLFMDTGIGHRHYAIIEQGKISHVVESKPEDIRGLIEEAAGITKFKVKKKAALRKIDLTNQNLLRLGDIVAEVSRYLSSLKRQAQRASRYRALKKEIKHLEITRAVHHLKHWRDERELLEQNLRTRQDAQAERVAQLAQLDSEVTDRSVQAQQVEERLQQRREALFRIKSTISSEENSLLHLQRQTRELQEREDRLVQEIQGQEERQQQLSKEKDHLKAEQQRLDGACSQAETLSRQTNEDLNQEKGRLNQLNEQMDVRKTDLVDLLGEIARIRNRRLSIRKRLEELQQRRKRREQEYHELQEARTLLQPRSQGLQKETAAIHAETDKLTAEESHLQHKSRELDERKSIATSTITSLESTYHQQRSQLNVLTEMENSYAWFNDAVRTLISAEDAQELQCNIRGAVAEMLEVDVTHRQAVEAALGGRLQALVVDSPADACAAMEYLKRTEAGRNYFIPLSVTGMASELPISNDGPVPLTDLVRPRPGHEAVVHFLLAKVMYCRDLQQALDWWESHPNICVLVTSEGDLVDPDGAIWGGSREKKISILEKQGEMKNLEASVADLEQALTGERHRLNEIEEELGQIISLLQEIQGKQRQLRDQLLEQEKERYRLENEEQKIVERFAILEVEKTQDEDEASQLQGERSQEELELEDLEARQHKSEENLAEAQHQRQELENTVDRLQEQTTAQQVSVGALVEKREAAHSSYLRLVDYHAEGEQRLHQFREEKEACRQQVIQLDQEQRQTREGVEQAHKDLAERETHLKDAEEGWREFEAKHRELEGRRLQFLQQDRQEEQELQRLHQEITELDLKAQYLMHQTQERYHLDLSQQTSADPEEPLDIDKMEAKLQKLRDQVARIGEVNLTAIEEYEEQQQRYDFLTTQRDDLVQSLDGLKKAISRINRTTRKKFIKTLEAVNRKLTEVFPLLFNGGTGYLQLLDERDPLESGVEILAHPPGKRLISMTLLSGGEKALAAVALLFSLYMIRPSPFCILDEVDAPLDEANIDRFIQVLKKISQESQIIMITHNKRTMEISDALLGVTMEEPGISRIISVNFEGVSETHGEMV